MRIVHIEDNFYPEFGYQLNFLAKWNAKHGHEVHILTSNSLKPWISSGFLEPIEPSELEKKDVEYCEKTDVVEVKRFKSFMNYSGREFVEKGMFDYALTLNPDVVMVHGLESLTGIRALGYFTKRGIPVVFDSHSARISTRNRLAPLFHRWFSKFIAPKINSRKIEVVAVSQATKDFLVSDLGIDPSVIEVIPLGTDTELFKPLDLDTKREKRREYGIEDDDFVFVYTGKITPDKKVNLLIDAFEKLSRDGNENVKLLVVGSGRGEYYERVVRKVQEIRGVVHLPRQPLDKLPEIYGISDVAIWAGGCSLSVFDAQAVGLPAILENDPVNIERVSHGNGVVFEKNSIDDLRNKMEEFLNMSEGERTSMSKKAREFVLENHSYDVIAKEFERVFEKAVEGLL